MFNSKSSMKKIISLLLVLCIASTPALSAPSLFEDPEILRKSHVALDGTIAYFKAQEAATRIGGYVFLGIGALISLGVIAAAVTTVFEYFNQDQSKTTTKNQSKTTTNVSKAIPYKPTLANIKGKQPKAFDDLKAQINDYDKHKVLGGAGIQHILLYGPPGTGKTKRAEHIAAQLGAYFFNPKPSDFQPSVTLGAAMKEVGDLFKRVRACKPKDFKPGDKPYAVVFMDEINSIACDRATTDSRVTSGSYPANPLDTLLTETDPDNEQNKGILVIGATNRKEVLDEAILSRLKNHIEIPLPDAQDLRDICHELALKRSSTLFGAATHYKRDGTQEQIVDNSITYTFNEFEGINFKENLLEGVGCSGRDVKTILDAARNRAATNALNQAHINPPNKPTTEELAASLLFPGRIPQQRRTPKITQQIYDEVLGEFINARNKKTPSASGQAFRSEQKRDEHDDEKNDRENDARTTGTTQSNSSCITISIPLSSPLVQSFIGAALHQNL